MDFVDGLGALASTSSHEARNGHPSVYVRRGVAVPSREPKDLDCRIGRRDLCFRLPTKPTGDVSGGSIFRHQLARLSILDLGGVFAVTAAE